MLEYIQDWLHDIEQTYDVNPFIFAGIYIGAIPLFWLGIYWLVRNYNQEKSLTLPILFIGSAAISSYIYLLFVGQNIPIGVYVVIIALILYSVYTVYKKVQEKTSTD